MKFRLTLLFVYFQLFISAHSQSIGSVAPDAVVLDAAEISEIHEGFAIVRKGDSYAIIDAKGKYLVPYGQYLINEKTTAPLNNSYDPYRFGFINGYCKVRDNLSGKFGLIDTTGKLFLPCVYYDIDPFTNDGYCLLVEKTERGIEYYYMDKKRNRIPVKSDYPRYYNNGLARTREGYIDRQGNVKIKTNNFRNFKDFSEGLAAVCRVNDYGIQLWGFIDTTGKMIIPCQFKNEPGPFSEGLSLTQPENSDEYLYAFINRDGIIKFSIQKPKDIPFAYGKNKYFNKRSDAFYSPSSQQFVYMDQSRGGDFIKGNSFWERSYFYDTAGRVYNAAELLPPELKISSSTLNIMSSDGMNFKIFVYGFGHCNRGSYGIISNKGEMKLPIKFCELQDFDKKSGLAYAEFRTTDRPSTMSSDFRKGIINQEGVFILLIP